MSLAFSFDLHQISLTLKILTVILAIITSCYHLNKGRWTLSLIMQMLISIYLAEVLK